MALVNQEQAAGLREALDSATLKELIDMYVSFAQDILQEVAQQIAANDYTTLKATAHNLKGSSANIGAEGLQMLAKQMEGFALESDVASLNNCYNDMKEILQETVTELYKAYGI
jgi:HPt (histidine-containing phosphotransfer) domain-containing protein